MDKTKALDNKVRDFLFPYERRPFVTSDFSLLLHRNSFNIHLKLVGHFDAAAAQQLFTFIKGHGEGAGSIFIHTSNTKQIHPTRPDIFRCALYGLNNHFFDKLIFYPVRNATLALLYIKNLTE